MQSRGLALSLVAWCWSAGAVLAQVDSNVAVTEFAQTRGTPCASRGDLGCGGCYPAGILPEDPLSDPITYAQSLITEVNPEWAPIGPMIDTGGGVPMDSSVPPASAPVTLTGTVALSKINEGGDFPASHVTNDQNTFIDLDPASAGLSATGNGGGPSCPGEGCSRIEMEWEISKYPLFAWAAEGDRIMAVGRWIFDCGHPDPDPVGNCTTSGDACILDSECGSETCTDPAATFNYRAELHPPQAVVVFRNKGVKRIPGIQADVYISADGGGAGDECTVTHLADPIDDMLFSPTAKRCFLNHCSTTTNRSCKTNKDCPGKETCVDLDPAQRLANINASDLEFDMPLPPPPSGASTIKDLKIKTKKFKPKGGIMPKPIFTLPTTAALHVKIPMTTPIRTTLPNVFAARIAAGWKHDTTQLTRVRVRFQSITINNPLKSNVVSPPRQCFTQGGGPTTTSCSTDADCPQLGTCHYSPTTPCANDTDCGIFDWCSSKTFCAAGIIPGWDLFAQVNGDWMQFDNLANVGAVAPFAAPKYFAPPTPVPLKAKFKVDEYVPAGGDIRISTTGTSKGCLDLIYGTNLADDLTTYSIEAAAGCLLQFPHNPGHLDITHSGADFATVSGATCTGPDVKGVLTCSATSSGGDGGSCTLNTNLLCTSDTDCNGNCSTTQGLCTQNSDCKHCSNDTTQFCATDGDCDGSNTCVANSGSETCDNFAGTCNVTGGAFTLNYTVQKR